MWKNILKLFFEKTFLKKYFLKLFLKTTSSFFFEKKLLEEEIILGLPDFINPKNLTLGGGKFDTLSYNFMMAKPL